MLLGTHTPKIDDKGRIFLPAKFREELSEGVVMTRGQERCLYVFSKSEFAGVHEKIRQAPVTSEEARKYLRVFLSGASDD
ncbi:MAG: cell division/cell wall cluster transcriptional repressor MraZ, partial [Aquiluna sp.]